MTAEEIIAKVEEKELIENWKELIFQKYLNCQKSDIKEVLDLSVKIHKTLVRFVDLKLINANVFKILADYNTDTYKTIKNIFF